MSQSLLLKIARESITEVFEAQHTIDKTKLFEDYPVLKEPLAAFVSIYLDNELRGLSGSVNPSSSLLEEIIYHAKVAAFQDKHFAPLSVSQYLKSKIELSLLTPLHELNYTDIEDLRSKVTPAQDGLSISLGNKNAVLLPQFWSKLSSFDAFFEHLLAKAGLNKKDLDSYPKIYSFQVEKSHDEPILD